jgi:peptidylprolyl isomerase
MQKFLFSLLLSTRLFANTEMQTLSEALGHLLGKQLEQLDVAIDLTALSKGMEDRAAGIPSPLEDQTCLQQIAKIQENKIKQLEKKNLFEAEKYLSQNKNKDNIVELIEEKLQIEILREGSGQILQLDNCPIIRLSGHFLDGKTFLDSENELLISLDESTPALQLGLAGMREGEVRTLYVHPTLSINEIEPNALQIFQVELIRADAGADEQIALESFDLRSLQ